MLGGRHHVRADLGGLDVLAGRLAVYGQLEQALAMPPLASYSRQDAIERIVGGLATAGCLEGVSAALALTDERSRAWILGKQVAALVDAGRADQALELAQLSVRLAWPSLERDRGAEALIAAAAALARAGSGDRAASIAQMILSSTRGASADYAAAADLGDLAEALVEAAETELAVEVATEAVRAVQAIPESAKTYDDMLREPLMLGTSAGVLVKCGRVADGLQLVRDIPDGRDRSAALLQLVSAIAKRPAALDLVGDVRELMESTNDDVTLTNAARTLALLGLPDDAVSALDRIQVRARRARAFVLLAGELVERREAGRAAGHARPGACAPRGRRGRRTAA